MAMFATLSHGKLTSWEQVAAANGHNARTIEVPNARADGHPPVEVIDRPGNDLTERMRGRLAEAGIKKPRANAVLGFEDIYGASPGYWAERYPDGWQAVAVAELMQDPLVRAVTDFAQQKYGADNVVSITWHLDEKTPHAHVVSMPIVTREHARRGRKRKDGTVPAPVLKTTLAADQLRGGSKFALEKEHDEWAAFVAHLGLKRGQRGSELSAEELRDRRLRDRQASLEGERRATEQQAKVQQSAQAVVQLIESGKKDRDEIVERGRTQAAVILADANDDAEKIREAALAEAGEIRRTALAAAAAADLRERDLERREASLVAAEKQVRIDRARVGKDLARAEAKARGLAAREEGVALEEATLARLIAQLEPVLAVVRGAVDRLRTAPAEVRRWLDPTAAVDKAIQAAPTLLEQARSAARSRTQQQTPAPRSTEPAEDDLALQAALMARDRGNAR